MEEAEHLRLRLLELMGDLELNQATVAHDLDIASDYVSRLLYPLGKKGRKNIGLQTMRKFERAYDLPSGWFEMPLGSALPTAHGSRTSEAPKAAREPQIHAVGRSREITWPFHNVSYGRLMDLKRDLGSKQGHEALRELDSVLEAIVMKWERVAALKKKQSR
jgi:hypothetical protein